MDLSGDIMDIGSFSPGGLIRPAISAGPAGAAPGDSRPQPQTVAPAPQRRPDPETPTGPPPTFATTPLELDSNLDIRLARLKVAGYTTLRALAAREAAMT